MRKRNGWLGAELSKEALVQQLEPAAITAIDRLMQAGAGGMPFREIGRRHFSDPALDAALAHALTSLMEGRGLVVLRGIPVDRYPVEDLERIFWGVGSHFGNARSQSRRGDVMGHVTDVGRKTRGYTGNNELAMHADMTDIAGLLCVRRARSGGMNILSSSIAIHDILARENPEALAILKRGWYADRVEPTPWAQITPYRMPFFAEAGGLISCTRYKTPRYEIGMAAHGEKLTEADYAAIAAFDEVAKRDGVRFEMSLEPGEILLLNNFEHLHMRTAFEDWEDPAKKRLLLRLWLECDPARPIDPRLHMFENAGGRQGCDPAPQQAAA